MFRKIIALASSIFILFVAYYGSYLPLRKSQVFIATLQGLSSIRSFNDFDNAVSVPLRLSSPIGQEELVRNTGNIVLNLVSNGQNPEVMKAAVDFLESYYKPIIDSGHGMSFSQNLYILGIINQAGLIGTGEARYFEAAKNYYSEGLRLGPKRPQFLYGMFDVYRAENNVEKAKEIATQILNEWPSDDRVRKGIDDLITRNTPKR